jgi:hypothetical protein
MSREPLYNGDQVAHWEGDALVIDTVSMQANLGSCGFRLP